MKPYPGWLTLALEQIKEAAVTGVENIGKETCLRRRKMRALLCVGFEGVLGLWVEMSI